MPLDPAVIAALYLLAINGITFAMYGLDKRAAIQGSRRISEYALLMAGFLGGTVGAILGQRIFRHKTKKGSFQMRFWGLTLAQLGLLTAYWQGLIF